MTHYMKLWQDAFYKIAEGSKTIELRLNDEKRQKISVGDTINFNCTKNKDVITAKVKALYKFVDFKELYKCLPLDKCGYKKEELASAFYTDMNAYYTEEQIKNYGVLGIELYDVGTICDIKSELLNEQIYNLLSPSVFNPTSEKLLSRVQKYFYDCKTYAYAFIQDGEYVGIIVFDIQENISTILDIAVNSEYCGKGIGSMFVNFILDNFNINTIIAETDDDAVGFYKKRGFKAHEIETEHNVKRYICKFSSNCT